MKIYNNGYYDGLHQHVFKPKYKITGENNSNFFKSNLQIISGKICLLLIYNYFIYFKK